jgi:anti-anti-sigma regulatory factor
VKLCLRFACTRSPPPRIVAHTDVLAAPPSAGWPMSVTLWLSCLAQLLRRSWEAGSFEVGRMRLNLEDGVVGSSSALVVSGIIDWSTMAQFRAGLSRYVSRPRPDIRVDLTGLLSWSPEAQAALMAAIGTARLHGGRLVVSGLAPIPRWEARGSGLPGMDSTPRTPV